MAGYTHRLVWKERITKGVLKGLVVEKSFRTIIDISLKQIYYNMLQDENVLEFRLEKIDG